jgi:DNA-binding NarL/FixJ family response regulator
MHYHNQNDYNLRQAQENLSHTELDHFIGQPDCHKPLTIREFEILHLASNGLPNHQIADILSISVNTVKRHFDNIFNKLGVGNRIIAIVWALRQGFL